MTSNKNTPEQIAFFDLLATADVDRIRARIQEAPQLLSSFDYRSFGATPLTMACYAQNRQRVELLLDLGADPNRKSDWPQGPWSPLHCAVVRRDKELAEYLLSRGAVLDVPAAAGLGDLPGVARLLKSAPTRVNERGGDGCQPLHFADSVEMAEFLVQQGADLNGRCWDHFSTPLQYQCTMRPEVARWLLEAGAQPDIFSVVACGDTAALQLLLTQTPDLIQSRINATFFPPGPDHQAQNILTFTIGQDSTPLHAAAKCNQPAAVELLVRHGLSVNVRGAYDQATPLHIAAWNNNLAAAEALLANGADLEARSGHLHRNTPAGWAIVAGAAEVFEMLLRRGAQRHPWFLEDARESCLGKFNQVSIGTPQQRSRILAVLEQSH